jgi:hypothetical protein
MMCLFPTHPTASEVSTSSKASHPSLSRHGSRASLGQVPPTTPVLPPNHAPQAAQPPMTTNSDGPVGLNGYALHPIATTGHVAATGQHYNLDSAIEPEAPDSMGTEGEALDLDSLWNWGPALGGHGTASPVPGATHMHLAGPHLPQRFDALTSYGIGLGPDGTSTGSHSIPATSVNISMTMFPTSDFV